MPKFIGIHRMGGPVEESVFTNAWNSYKEACVKKGIKATRFNFSAEKGLAICETEANSIDEVKAAHEEVGMIPEEIIEVKTSE